MEDLKNSENKIEITKENIGVYKEFVYFFDKNYPCIYFNKKISRFLFVLRVVFTFIPLGLLLPFDLVFSIDGGISLFIAAVATTVCIPYTPFSLNDYFINKLTHKFNKKAFMEKYPNFDINSNVDEIRKAIEEYQKITDEEKDEHLSNIKNNNFEEMSTRDKIDFLNRERNFWEQVRKEEAKELEEKQEEPFSYVKSRKI